MRNTWIARLESLKWTIAVLTCLVATAPFRASAEIQGATTYIVVLSGSDSPNGFEVGGSNLLNLQGALSAVTNAGGVVTADLTGQIGVVIASSASPTFVDRLRENALVAAIGEDVAFKAIDDVPAPPAPALPRLPAPGEDPLEFAQWGMRMIHADQARTTQMGSPAVDVAVLDSGVDATHQDFFVGLKSNIDTMRARSFVPDDPSALVDNCLAASGGVPFCHGTFVAGIIGARKNGIGMVGVAPNVTIVPIKVVEAENFARPSWVVQGIVYAGDIQVDVINMSFFTDDETPQTSTQFKCTDDPEQLAYRVAHERAIRYARKRGAVAIAAAGNDGIDLSADTECDQIPAETPGVVAVGALDVSGVLTSYSQYGLGAIDLVAPSGSFLQGVTPDPCDGQTLSTSAGNAYLCGTGTSFAAPHVSGVAALVISQFGRLGADGDVKMPPSAVENLLFGSAVDIGIPGEDTCYGLGRVDALRAVRADESALYQARDCLRYYAPPPANSCPGPQVTDAVNDALGGGLPSLSNHDHLDIVSAAFTADGGGNLQITLTIKDLSAPPPPADFPGAIWAVFFDYGDTRYAVQAYGVGSPESVRYTAGPFTGNEDGNDQSPNNPPLNPAITGSFNPGPNGTIVFTVPLSLIGNPPAGAQLTNLDAVTYLADPVSVSPRVDRAPNALFGADYTVGQVCIPPAP